METKEQGWEGLIGWLFVLAVVCAIPVLCICCSQRRTKRRQAASAYGLDDRCSFPVLCFQIPLDFYIKMEFF